MARRPSKTLTCAQLMSELALVREQYRQEMSITSSLRHCLELHRETIRQLERELRELRGVRDATPGMGPGDDRVAELGREETR